MPDAKPTGHPESDDRAVPGQLEVVTVRGGWPSRTAWILVSKIAGVVAIRKGGPARLLFIGGGHIDVCGSAEIWRRQIAIAELESQKAPQL